MELDTELKTKTRTHGPRVKIFPWKVFFRTAITQAAVILLALGALHFAAEHFFKKQFIAQVESQLKQTLSGISQEAPLKPVEQWCVSKGRVTELRITVVSQDGQVLCDSEHDPQTMENHAGRPEIVAARKTGFGATVRRSDTLNMDMLYGAIIAPHDYIVRGAIPLNRLTQSMRAHDRSLAVVFLIIAGVVIIGALWSARQLVFPVGRLLVKTKDVLSARAESECNESLGRESYGEWGDLELTIEDIRRDLTDKSQSLQLERKQLETILGALSDAIVAVDLLGAPLFFNIQFEMLFGAQKVREPGIKLWGIVRNPDLLHAFEGALHKAEKTETKVIGLEVLGPGGQAVKRFFTLSVAPLKKQDGAIYGAAGIFHDVTELKSVEQMRIDFVANVSHELRTPLTSIKGFAETIKDDLSTGSVPPQDFADAIVRNSDRLMSLLSDLLDLSSIESADVLQKELIDTEEITARAMGQVEEAFSSKKQATKTVISAAKVTADPHRVEQVLVNLLSNANKYTPEGSEVKVEWSKGVDGVFLKVTDNGPGIPIEHQSRLFERFYRVDRARSREQGGTGLGLAIVKHIMQRHGGKVWVESELSKGTTFVCQFPDSKLNLETPLSHNNV